MTNPTGPNQPSSVPAEKAGPILPDAVYVDACALFQLPETGEDVHKFAALRSLAERWHAKIFAPEVAVREWKQRKLEDLRNTARQLTSSWRRLSRFTDLGPLPSGLGDGLHDSVSERLDSVLERFGITIVGTPKDLDMAVIMDMAVRKVRPFEEKGEKGFRDTLILFTMVQHMQTENTKNALLVSGDDVFDHADVAGCLHERGLVIVRASDFADAEDRLKNAGQYAVFADLREWSPARG